VPFTCECGPRFDLAETLDRTPEGGIGSSGHFSPACLGCGRAIEIEWREGSFVLTAAAVVCGRDCNWEKTPAFVIFYGGIGAGIGALIDRHIRGRKTVFASVSQPTLGLAPLVEAGHKGVRVALRF
jgi:hypothetical protein